MCCLIDLISVIRDWTRWLCREAAVMMLALTLAMAVTMIDVACMRLAGRDDSRRAQAGCMSSPTHAFDLRMRAYESMQVFNRTSSD